MTRAQRRKRQRSERHSPGTLARAATVQGVALDTNPNRGKRDAAPVNYDARVIAAHTLRDVPTALRVATPLRTPTNRHARRGGVPLYSEYVIGSALPNDATAHAASLAASRTARRESRIVKDS